MSVYMDTSAILAVLDADDDNHATAGKIWTKLLHARETLMCSSYVLVESCALVQRRLGMEALRTFQEDLVPLLRVEWVEEAIHQQAMEAVLIANRKDLSLVDCASFTLMRHCGVKKAFTFDRHFSGQGFECLT